MNDGKKGSRAVVFLDRDGTLNVESGYIRNLNDLHLIEGAGAAVRKLNQAQVAAILVTNQTGAARGYYPLEHIHNLNQRLVNLLKDEGAFLDDVYYCPHLEEGVVKEFSFACQCRKPMTGLVDRAFSQHPELDRRRAFVIGDKATDVELAVNCAITGILVSTGYGERVQAGEYQWKVAPDFTAASIVEAVDWILSRLEQTKAS